MTNDDGTLAFTPASLTKRQKAVLSAICDGLTNEQIASRFGMEAQTVKNHVYQIFKKIGVGSRTQAILWAYRNGHANLTEASHEQPEA